MRKSLRKISAAIAGCALAMALTVSAVPNTADAATKPQSTKAGIKAGKAKFEDDCNEKLGIIDRYLHLIQVREQMHFQQTAEL